MQFAIPKLSEHERLPHGFLALFCRLFPFLFGESETRFAAVQAVAIVGHSQV